MAEFELTDEDAAQQQQEEDSAAAAAVLAAVVAAALPNVYAASKEKAELLEETGNAALDAEVAAAQVDLDPEEEDPMIFAKQTILFDVGNGQDVELDGLSVVQLKAQLKRYKRASSASRRDRAELHSPSPRKKAKGMGIDSLDKRRFNCQRTFLRPPDQKVTATCDWCRIV